MSGNDNTNYTVVTVTAAYTANANDYHIIADGTGGSFAVTLPAASAALVGREFVVWSKTTSGTITVKTAGGTINGAAAGTGVALTATTIGGARAICDGTNWLLAVAV